MSLSRREFLTAGALLAAPAAAAGQRAWKSFEFAIPSEPRGARRALVALPARAALEPDLPVLVLLHGLGETRSEEAGAHAWLDAYGLGSAWDRLAAPPLPREPASPLSEDDYAAIERSLQERPFAGLCVVCPYLPNPHAAPRDPTLEGYARWLEGGLLPALRDRVPQATRSAARTGIAGVSLGGFAAIEVCLRRPQLFGTLGCVQGAFAAERGAVYARKLAPSFRGEQPRVYVASSKQDPYRAANLAFARALKAEGVASEWNLRNGAHSQDWLKKVGSLDLLLWHDRALRRSSAASVAER